jgi:hypothetical protein
MHRKTNGTFSTPSAVGDKVRVHVQGNEPLAGTLAGVSHSGAAVRTGDGVIHHVNMHGGHAEIRKEAEVGLEPAAGAGETMPATAED